MGILSTKAIKYSSNKQTTLFTMSSTTTKINKEIAFTQNSNDSNGISLVLPRVHRNTTSKKIFAMFRLARWGFIDRVDMVPPEKDEDGNRVVLPQGRWRTAFVHFRPNSWNKRDDEARAVLDKLSESNQSRIKMFNDKYDHFWWIKISESVKPDESPKVAPKSRPSVEIEANGAAALAAGILLETACSTPLPSDVAPVLTRSDDHRDEYDATCQPDEELRMATDAN